MKHITIFILAFAAVSCASIKDVQIAQFDGGRKAALSLTFDDGSLEHYTLVAPELEKNGLRGTFYVCGSFFNIDGTKKNSLTWEMARDMIGRGHEIGNHSWSHPDLTEVDDSTLFREVKLNDEVITDSTGVRPPTFGYPYGAYDDRVLACCLEDRVGSRKGYRSLGQSKHHMTPEKMEAMLEETIAAGGWLVTVTHGITKGYDIWEEPDQLWEIFARIAALDDTLWTAPMRDVAAYVAERDACTLDIARNGRRWTVTPDCQLDSTLFKAPLTLQVSKSNGKTTFMRFDPFGGPFIVK